MKLHIFSANRSCLLLHQGQMEEMKKNEEKSRKAKKTEEKQRNGKKNEEKRRKTKKHKESGNKKKNIPSSHIYTNTFKNFYKSKDLRQDSRSGRHGMTRRTAPGSSRAPCYQRDLFIFCSFSANCLLIFG